MKAALQFALDFWWLALVAVIVGLWVSNEGLRADLADAKLAVETERADREAAARGHETALGKREREHATEQQKDEEKYAAEKQNLAGDLRVATVDNKRLRAQITAATSRGNSGNPTDPVACERAINRLDELGGLAGEGSELLVEARHLLLERDLDVRRLQGQVAADRKACGQQEMLGVN